MSSLIIVYDWEDPIRSKGEDDHLLLNAKAKKVELLVLGSQECIFG